MRFKGSLKIKIFLYFLLSFLVWYIYDINKQKYESLLGEKIKEDNKKNILFPYIEMQNDFCKNKKKYFNKNIEDKLMIKKVHFKNYSYYMYVYKNVDAVSSCISKQGSFEGKEAINILKALQHYGEKKNITNNNEIYILDIGGNIGWYPSFLGRFGYYIISFEPFETNYYILYKNFCLLNKKNNVIIVNKGIDIEEKSCDVWIHKKNIGNGMIICKENLINNNLIKGFEKSKKVNLTKLSNFIPFLSNKNLALIKIDIEGGEGKAFESGIDLITKYHVPFILIEITPIYLKEHGTNTYQLIKLFTRNGYYISLVDFVKKIFISETELLELLKKVTQVNAYFIHKDMIN